MLNSATSTPGLAVLAIRRLWRWAWVPVLLSLGAMTLAYVLRPSPGAPIATVEIGLDNDIGWPYHDQERERAVGLLDDGTLLDDVALDQDTDDAKLVDVTSPEDEAYFSVSVSAATGGQAISLADGIASELIERTTLLERTAIGQDVEILRSQVLLRNEELSVLVAELDDLSVARAQANENYERASPEDRQDEELAVASIDSMFETVQSDRDVLQTITNGLASELAKSELSLDRIDGSVVVTRSPYLGTQSFSDSLAPVILAGITGFVLGLILSRILDLFFGRLSTVDEFASLTALPVHVVQSDLELELALAALGVPAQGTLVLAIGTIDSTEADTGRGYGRGGADGRDAMLATRVTDYIRESGSGVRRWMLSDPNSPTQAYEAVGTDSTNTNCGDSVLGAGEAGVSSWSVSPNDRPHTIVASIRAAVLKSQANQQHLVMEVGMPTDSVFEVLLAEADYLLLACPGGMSRTTFERTAARLEALDISTAFLLV